MFEHHQEDQQIKTNNNLKTFGCNMLLSHQTNNKIAEIKNRFPFVIMLTRKKTSTSTSTSETAVQIKNRNETNKENFKIFSQNAKRNTPPPSNKSVFLFGIDPSLPPSYPTPSNLENFLSSHPLSPHSFTPYISLHTPHILFSTLSPPLWYYHTKIKFKGLKSKICRAVKIGFDFD